MPPLRRSPSGRHRTIAAYIYNYWTREEALLLDAFITGLMQDLRHLSFEVGKIGPRLPYLTIFDIRGRNVVSIYREKAEHRVIPYSLYVADMETPIHMHDMKEIVTSMEKVVRNILEFDEKKPLATDLTRSDEHSFVRCRFVGGEPY